MSPSFKYLRQMALSMTVILAASLAMPVSAQTFDQFRLIGNHAEVSSGLVTSIHFSDDQNRATIDYLNVAGMSEQLAIQLTPSTTISDALPVFMPGAQFVQPAPGSLDLSGISFFHGTIPLDDGGLTPPPHWFRLTRLDDRWSGIFRVDHRIYTIDRYTTDSTVTVRPAAHGDLLFLPDKRVKVSAVIDEHYVNADVIGDLTGMDNLGHLFALESIHNLDGILSDSLGIGILLEQLIYQPAVELGEIQSPLDVLSGAEAWTDKNAEAFGLTDNLATLFFRGHLPTDSSNDPYANLYNDHIAAISNSPDYQFITAHLFGRIIELPFETNTLRHYQTGKNHPLPDVLWSEGQQQYLVDNPLPLQLVQIINYDAPELAEQPEDKAPQELDNSLLVAEQPEYTSLFNDGQIQNSATEAPVGAGTFAPFTLLLPVLLRRRQLANVYS